MDSCSGPKAAGAANHAEPGTVSCQGICQPVKDPTSHSTTCSSALPVQPTQWSKAPEITIPAVPNCWSHRRIHFEL